MNRSNLGMSRIFSAFLAEGKEPPQVTSLGEGVRLTMRASELSPAFLLFVQEQEQAPRLRSGQAGTDLPVDHLLVLQHLLRHPEADTKAIARICQRTETDTRELMSHLERVLNWVERGGRGRSTYWTLARGLWERMALPGHPDRDREIDWEAAKTRVLSTLVLRAQRGGPGLSNSDVRHLTQYGRTQVKRLMNELREEGQAELLGLGRFAQWVASSSTRGRK